MSMIIRAISIFLCIFFCTSIKAQSIDSDILTTEVPEGNLKSSRHLFCYKKRCENVIVLNNNNVIDRIYVRGMNVSLVENEIYLPNDHSVSAYFSEHGAVMVRVFYRQKIDCQKPSPDRDFISIIFDKTAWIEKLSYSNCHLVEVKKSKLR